MNDIKMCKNYAEKQIENSKNYLMDEIKLREST